MSSSTRQTWSQARTGVPSAGALLAVVTVLAMSMLSATAARGNSVNASKAQLVSGLTPLPRKGENRFCGTDLVYQDWESDNSLSVDPTNPDNLAAAWIQDWADAIVVGYSTDGGRNWSKSVPPTTPCTGGLTVFGTEPGTVSALDPWLSFGPPVKTTSPGIAYLSSVVSGGPKKDVGPVEDVGPVGYAAVLNRSLDGGKTWSDPKILDTAATGLYIDGSNVIADPARPGYAYAKWDKGDYNFTESNQYVSRTTDEGQTWSPLPPVLGSAPGRLTHAGSLLVLGDGTLVDVYAEYPPQPLSLNTCGCVQGSATLVVRRLENPGEPGSTWSPPITIPQALGGTAALAPDGKTIYVVWPRADASGQSFSLMYSKSADGGRSWQEEPGVVGPSIPGPVTTSTKDIPAAPSLAVAPDGTVGVAFYDHRRDPPRNDPPKKTDSWFRHSHDGGASWQEDHVAGPFDKTTVPPGLGGLGDYQGIAPIAGGFATTLSLAEPLAGKNTDIFFSRTSSKR